MCWWVRERPRVLWCVCSSVCVFATIVVLLVGDAKTKAGPAGALIRRRLLFAQKTPPVFLSLSLSPATSSHRERARAALPCSTLKATALTWEGGKGRSVCVSVAVVFCRSLSFRLPPKPHTHRHVVLDRERQRLHRGGRVEAALGRVERQLARARGAGVLEVWGTGKDDQSLASTLPVLSLPPLPTLPRTHRAESTSTTSCPRYPTSHVTPSW